MLATLSYGLWVPAGLFLPAIIIGCSLGSFYADMVRLYLPHTAGITDQSFVIVGAAGMLAGQSRLTYSLAVIMLETTQSLNLFLPVICTIIVANLVGNLVSKKSIYGKSIELKNYPVLGEKIPISKTFLRAEEVMTTGPLVTVKAASQVIFL
jgi:chloride channel 7